MPKIINAVYNDSITAQRVVHELVAGDILTRHEIQLEPVDPDKPSARTRVRAWMMGGRAKQAKKLMEKHQPVEIMQEK